MYVALPQEHRQRNHCGEVGERITGIPRFINCRDADTVPKQMKRQPRFFPLNNLTALQIIPILRANRLRQHTTQWLLHQQTQ
jgi:hypothetical protein